MPLPVFKLIDADVEEAKLRRNLLVVSILTLAAHNLHLHPPIFPAVTNQTSFYEVFFSHVISTGVPFSAAILFFTLIYLFTIYLLKTLSQLFYFVKKKLENDIDLIAKLVEFENSFSTEGSVHFPTELELERRKYVQKKGKSINRLSQLLQLARDANKILKRALPLLPASYALIKTYPESLIFLAK